MTALSDYYVVTFATNEATHPWAWEIKRRSGPMGFRLTDNGFQSQASAEIAGNLALKEFLEALAKRTKFLLQSQASAEIAANLVLKEFLEALAKRTKR